MNNGSIFWNGRQVNTDEELRHAALSIVGLVCPSVPNVSDMPKLAELDQAVDTSKLPFLFARLENADDIERGSLPKIKDWAVMIASHHDLTVYDAHWMDDPDIGKFALIPDVDLRESVHIFPDFLTARAFVKDWWASN